MKETQGEISLSGEPARVRQRQDFKTYKKAVCVVPVSEEHLKNSDSLRSHSREVFPLYIVCFNQVFLLPQLDHRGCEVRV